MAAYQTEARLFPGSHLAILFIGMEYLKQYNFKLALHQFDIAKDICQTDPNIFSEIGTAHYKQGNYKEA